MYLQKTVKDTAERGLFLIATPIGNMEDITERAMVMLGNVDYILAEDTRVSRKLLNHLGIEKQLISFHTHNQYEKTRLIIADVQAGKRIGLISDAGLPGISDPGGILVQAMVEASLPVTIIPGVSAGVSLFTLSGFSEQGKFLFHGFLPTKTKAKEAVFEKYRSLSIPLVFYESPHRILKTLATLATLYPASTKVVLGRELTKLHETLLWFTLAEFQADTFAQLMTWKGEITFIVFNQVIGEEQFDDETILDLLEAELIKGVKPKEAMKIVAEQTGEKPNALYDLWQKHKKE